MIGLWIVGGIAAWLAVAVPVALVIGRTVRVADGARLRPAGRHDKHLVYRCARCGQRVNHSSERLVDSVDSIHELECAPVVQA